MKLVEPEEEVVSLYPHQMRALMLSLVFPIVFLSGGVRNGKTRALANWIRVQGGYTDLKPPPPPGVVRRLWIVCPTRDPYWENIRPEVEAVLGWADDDGNGLIVDKSERGPTYVLAPPDDGPPFELVVRSAENPDSLRGATIYGAAMTEAGAIPTAEPFKILRGRVLASKGSLFLESSPFGLNWFWSEGVDKGGVVYDYSECDYRAGKVTPREIRSELLSKDKKIAVIRGVPIHANLSLDGQWIEDYKTGLSEEEQKRELKGDFFQWAGLVWRNFDPRTMTCPPIKPGSLPQGWKVWGGFDFGFGHPTAHLWLAKKGKRVVVLDEYRAGGLTLAEHAKGISENPWNKYVEERYADPSAAQERADLADMGKYSLSTSDAENDVDLGVNAVATAFERGNLLIARNCVKLLSEVGNYHRDVKNGKIVKKEDDLCDCLRYGVYTDWKHGLGALPHASIDPVDGKVKIQGDDPERVAEYVERYGNVDDDGRHGEQQEIV